MVSGGGVKCWGWNGNGQLGIGSWTNFATPVDVAGNVPPPTQGDSLARECACTCVGVDALFQEHRAFAAHV